ncbi:YfhO family protein [bacterium]|nr:YfhO family protein [bacterium]
MGKKARKLSREKRKQGNGAIPEQAVLKIPFTDSHPHWTAAILILALLLIFYNQVMLSDNVFTQPDVINSRTSQNFVKDALDSGTYPLWNPYIFCGMPSFASLTNAPYVDITGTIIYGALAVIGKAVPFTGFIRLFANYMLLAIMMYLLIRGRGLASGSALFAAVALVFMPQIVAYSVFGHSTKLASAVFIPLIFLLVERLLERRSLLFFSLAGLAIGLQLLRAHVQICYYTQMMIGLYFIYWAVIQLRTGKKAGPVLTGAGLLAGAVVMGVLVSSVLNLSVLEYAKYSIRGGSAGGGLDFAYATNWSLPPAEVLNFLVPSFMGFGGDTYWGPMIFTDFPVYFGVVTMFLAGLSLVIRRNRITWFFVILAALALLASFGKHFPVLFGPMFKLLPFFNKFRAPKMINILIGFSLTVLAAYGIEGLITMGREARAEALKNIRTYSLYFIGVVLALLLFLLIGQGLYLKWASQLGNMAHRAYSMATNDALRSLLLVAAAAGVSLTAVRRPKLSPLVPLAFIVLVCIDVWPVNKRFMHPRPNEQQLSFFSETADVAFLKSREGIFRVWPLGYERLANFPNLYMYYRLQSISGYSAVKMSTYQNFIDRMLWPNGFPYLYLTQNPENPQRLIARPPAEMTPELRRMHEAFMKMLNVRYVVTPFNINTLDPALQTVLQPSQTGTPGVFEYSNALPRAFLVDSVAVVSGGSAALDYIASGEFDPAHTAILEEPPEFAIVPDPENSVTISKYSIHDITVQAEIKTPSLMVLSEMYYPAGWNAYIDGEKTTIYKTDYLLRSVFLKPGSHVVEFTFEPAMFRLGLLISIIALVLLAAGIWGGYALEKKRTGA